MGGVLFSIMAFVVVLFPLVMLHELGHYWAARRYGVGVEVFSIGLGPQLVGWTDRAGTRWKVCLFFVGGYVKMRGDGNIASSAPDTSQPLDKDSFFAKSPAQRIIIALAGPLMNYVLAFALVLGLGMSVGRLEYKPILGVVEKTGLAFQGGLRKGDRIVAVQGVATPTYGKLVEVLNNTPSKDPLHIDLQRQEHLLAVTLTHPAGQADKPWRGTLGISFDAGACYYTQRLSFLHALRMAGDFLVSSFQILKSRSLGDLQGPLGIAHQSALIFHKGVVEILFFMANLSAGLGLLNILPIPLLDGGNILLTTVEWLRGRPLGEKLQNFVFTVALVGLLSVFLVLSWKDLQRLLIP